jgi:biofilm PGA synthesis lipoprotein PgaB
MEKNEVMRAMQVDLDYVYDPDHGQEEKNLRLLLERVRKLGVNTVLLQAFADPDGNDCAEELYFPSRHLPMRGNLFARTAAALRKTGVRVYAWMPLLAFDLGPDESDLLVRQQAAAANRSTGERRTPRLSPFHPKARRIIRDMYMELAKSAVFDGILFHDDSVLNDYEDASPSAMAAYRQAGFPADITTIRAETDLLYRWSRFKTRYIIDFSLSLVRLLRKQHPGLRSARAIYGRAILQPESEAWLGQSLPLFLQAYDYSVILAMPYLEKASNHENWLAELADRALFQALRPGSLVFELQTVDWWRKEKIPTSVILRQIDLLRRHGVVSFAYYPDDFFHDHPRSSPLNRAMKKERCQHPGGWF